MNFQELKSIIAHIKRTMRCPQCNGKYTDEMIEVIGCMDHKESFFHAYCPHCDDESCIHVNHDSQTLPNGEVRLGTAPRMQHISSNEVLDMHNFLKGFQGNFKEMFQEEKPS